jgi:hypothetical protein
MQSELIRFVYVSQATFKPFSVGADSEIDSYVINILNQSRKNNKNRNLVGALYYGNGCFFQCLEGEKTDIDALYKILLQDPRHKNLEILTSQAIEKIGFSSWEMKYATIDQEVRTFLRKYSLAKFDPYRFTPAMTDELVSTLQQAEDEISTAALEKIAMSLPELPIESKDGIQLGKVLFMAILGMIILACVIYFQN